MAGINSALAQSSVPQLAVVDVSSEPAGALVIMYDVNDKDYQKSCVAPCKLEVDVSRYLATYGQKDGYSPRHNKQPTLPGLGTPTKIIIRLFTPDEEKENEIKKKEARAKKAEHDRWVERMYADLSQLPKVPNCEGISEQKISVRRTNRYRASTGTQITTEESCTVRFNISIDGFPGDVEAINCTHPALEASSMKTIIGSRYEPRVIGGEKLPYCGIEQKFRHGINKVSNGRTRRTHAIPHTD